MVIFCGGGPALGTGLGAVKPALPTYRGRSSAQASPCFGATISYVSGPGGRREATKDGPSKDGSAGRRDGHLRLIGASCSRSLRRAS